MNVVPLLVSTVFIVFDVLTGWLKALLTASFNSSVMRCGLTSKIGELTAVIFGYTCEYFMPLAGLPIELPFAEAIMTYIVVMEIASIVENICAMNPSLRNPLSKIFSDEKLPKVESEETGKHEIQSK